MSERSSAVLKSIGNFKLKSLAPVIAGIAIGWVLCSYFTGPLTYEQIIGIIDYIAEIWQKFS